MVWVLCNTAFNQISAILLIMISRRVSVPFAVSDGIRERLGRKAPAVLACGSNAAGCDSGRSEIHYCCSAHKILNPTVEAPLSWQHFRDTLAHYKIRVSEQDAKKAYQDYLDEACLLDASDDIAAASKSMCELNAAEDAAEDAGDKELAGHLAKDAYEKMEEMMGLVSEAKARARSMAASL